MRGALADGYKDYVTINGSVSGRGALGGLSSLTRSSTAAKPGVVARAGISAASCFDGSGPGSKHKMPPSQSTPALQ
jgi:hypothetical protein